MWRREGRRALEVKFHGVLVGFLQIQEEVGDQNSREPRMTVEYSWVFRDGVRSCAYGSVKVVTKLHTPFPKIWPMIVKRCLVWTKHVGYTDLIQSKHKVKPIEKEQCPKRALRIILRSGAMYLNTHPEYIAPTRSKSVSTRKRI